MLMLLLLLTPLLTPLLPAMLPLMPLPPLRLSSCAPAKASYR
jgi:hypothetical protein